MKADGGVPVVHRPWFMVSYIHAQATTPHAMKTVLTLTVILTASARDDEEWDVNTPRGPTERGLAEHWETWTYGQGWMSSHDALRSATIDGAAMSSEAVEVVHGH